MFTLEIGTLEPGLHSFTLEPSVEALELDPEKFKDVVIDARLDVSERRMLVSLDVRATATLECDRTLRRFDQEIDGSYYLLYAPADFLERDEDAYDEVRVMDPNAQEIDITDVVRDTILLAVPTRRIAPGAEDEEIPTVFGAPDEKEDAEVDPRWEALKELKSGANRN